MPWGRTLLRPFAEPSAIPEVIQALRKLKCRNPVLDGGMEVLDEAGRLRFQLLQARDLPGERPTPCSTPFSISRIGTGAFGLQEQSDSCGQNFPAAGLGEQ